MNAVNTGDYELKKTKKRHWLRRAFLLLLLAIGAFAAWTWKTHHGDFRAAADDLGRRFAELRTLAADQLAGASARVRYALEDARTDQNSGSRTTAASPARSRTEPWMRAENWTRAKAADIDSLTPDDIAAIESWEDQKPILRSSYDELRAAVASVVAVPAFRHDNGRLAALNAALDDFGRCLDGNDPLRIIYDVNSRVTAAANSWKASVRWQAGVRHPTAPHVHSGSSRNTWEPDDGYVFANASSDSLDVIYKGHAYRCSNCQGTGTVLRRTTCPKCSGQGRIPNPALTALNTGAAIVDIANALSSKRRSHRPIERVEDPGLQCPQCGGRRQITERVDCPHCEGGTVWK